jgi:hypothetical protein
MAEVVYMLCAITSVACATLLIRRYRAQPTRLLMWSALCFAGFAINNVMMFIDLVVVPQIDLSLLRSGMALLSVVLLLLGLLWEDS